MKKEKKRKRRKLIIIILLLLAILGGTCYYFFNKSSNQTTVVTGDFLPKNKDASKMKDKEIKGYAKKAVDASRFQMVIRSKINVKSNNNSSNLYIQNPPNNTYPIAVTISLKNKKVVYKSGAIKVGYEVRNAKLDAHLKPGTYTGTAVFKLYDAKTSKAKGQVAAKVTITVT